MKRIFVRPAKSSDGQKTVEWSLANRDNNQFDPEVVLYPSTFTLAAVDEEGPLMYMPIQQPLMLESLATRPDAEPSDVVCAGDALLHAAITQAHIKGCGEIYFLASEESAPRYAEKRGFKKVPLSVYRLKLSDLEK